VHSTFSGDIVKAVYSTFSSDIVKVVIPIRIPHAPQAATDAWQNRLQTYLLVGASELEA